MKPLKTTLVYTLAVTIGVACSLFLLTSFKESKMDHNSTTHTVLIQGMKFDPENLKVNKGDLVIWINKDIVPHDVTETDNNWTSGILKPGDKWSKKITEKTSYFCSIHVVMKGKVSVEN
jgi:plastocyanin